MYEDDARKTSAANTNAPRFSARMAGAGAALWLGWTLAFSLAQVAINGVVHSQLPHPGYMLLIFVVALAALWLGRSLWPAWRSALGLISIFFAGFAGILGLVRSSPARTSPVALGLSVLGSIVVGIVLLRAERSRRR